MGMKCHKFLLGEELRTPQSLNGDKEEHLHTEHVSSCICIQLNLSCWLCTTDENILKLDKISVRSIQPSQMYVKSSFFCVCKQAVAETLQQAQLLFSRDYAGSSRLLVKTLMKTVLSLMRMMLAMGWWKKQVLQSLPV